MALYDQNIGRSCVAVPGMECQRMRVICRYRARVSRLGVDSVVNNSVLFIETTSEDRTAMADRRDDTEKQDRLREAGTLNRTPEKVSDPMFAAGDFFDARDLLQVRYEMVRLVRVDEASLAQAAARFGGLAADLLPHGQGVRRGRAAGAHPGAARAARTAQDQPGDPALRRELQGPARPGGSAPAGPADRGRVRRQGSSARSREGARADSKKALEPGP